MRVVDLTHPITALTPSFPGDPKTAFETADVLPSITQITFSTHSGTHIDAPCHMFLEGKKLADFGPEKFFGRGVVLDARGRQEIGAEAIGGKELKPGDIVLIWTGWSEKYGQPEYFQNHPVMTLGLAEKLSAANVSLVGLDAPGPDKEPFAVHKLLLRKEILIIENLANLGQLEGFGNFEVIALPPRFVADGGPVRVVAKIYE